jgi:hypothetical protein
MMRGTFLIRLRHALTSHLEEQDRESGVAMLTAILFIIIMAGVSTIILGVVSAQTIPSYIDQKGTKTIYSAQAGIQAALAEIRSAATLDPVSGNTYGDTTKLPCSLTGTTNGPSDGNSYSVTIAYYTTDPTGSSPTAALSCGTGAYNSTGHGPVGTPKYALITSQGLASQIPVIGSTQANRTITALYTFKVSNVNILGGLIFNRDGTACMQASSTNPVPAPTITFVAAANCSATGANSTLQLWSYNSSWQIALSSTQAGGATGICITGPAVAGGATQNALLQACRGAADPLRWNQLWSWTGSYTWEGETATISGPNGSSWLSAGVADGSSAIGKNLLVSTSVVGTMGPTAQVGAGAASYKTHELVNYQEFGRCTDVTGENISTTYMIVYPCKQDPTGGTTYITWNQKWYYCEPTDIGITTACKGNADNGQPLTAANQQLYVYLSDNTSQRYCLTTPLTSAGNTYPYFAACATTGPLVAQQTWARVYNSGTYLTSYLLTDTYGRCLMSNPSYTFSGDIHELTSTSCNGSDYQKWNAPPAYTDSTVGGYREISGG